jgi:ABC-type uncharacterized transport system ATPase subunit
MSSASNSGAIIAADGLTREFRVRDGKRKRLLTAVNGLTVRIEPGEAVGYIGANGAGKSTSIKMLTGILVPTAGSVLTCGLRPVPDRRRLARQVGVVFGQRSQLWWDLPVRESFRILAAIHALTRARRATAPPSSSSSSSSAASCPSRCASCPWASGCAPRSPPRCCTRHDW